jgi:ferritin-like metal-binding protein YciE
MARAAENDTLRTAFETHLKETQGHAQRLEQVFQSLGEKVRGKHCDGMAGIIEEGKSKLEEDIEGTTLDACLIAAAQRAEHYEMAAYGTLVAWAKAMGHNEVVGLLESILEEEKATDEKLTQIAESGINEEAAAQAHGGDEEADDSSSSSRRAAPSRSSSRGRASSSRSSGRKGGSSSGSRKGSSRKRR